MTRATRPPGPLRVNRSTRANSLPKATRHPLPALRTVRPAPLANRLGDPVKADLKHQCMSCQRWMSCKDPAKAFGYRCSRWQELVTLDTGELFSDAVKNSSTRNEEPLLTPDIVVANLDERKQESTLEKLLDEALAAGLDVSPDLRVDDRDIPAPYNYDQWVTGRNFSGMTTDLFPIQHKILAEFNSEICPRCSDLKFLESMRVDTDLGEYRDRVVLLQNGKCPKCGVTKSELFVNGEINDYLSLFGIAGQRCLVGESLILTSTGPKRIDEFGDAAKSGWSPVTLTDSSGDPIKIMTPGGNLVDPVAFFVGEPVRLVLVTLDDGSTVAGSEEHPIMTAHGWRRLPEIRSGDVVPVFYPEWLERRVASVEVTETRGPVYDIHVPDHNSYLLSNGVWSHNSGKTSVVNVNEGYQTARWVKLPSPQRVFKVLDQQLLVSTYVALTLGQVRQNLWDPFVDSVTRSPFFRNLHALLDHYGAKYGEELYSVKDIFIRYRYKGLLLLPSGPNKRTMRGNTRVRGSVDELGWFPFGKDNEDKTKMSAEEVLKAVENSLATIQAKYESLMRSGNYTIPKPQLSCISSPSEINDAIMVRHRKSIGSTISYTFKRPTWEMNPELPRDCSFLKNKFQMDEEGAMRDFGCEPPMSSAAWIREITNAEGAFIKSANSIVVRQIRLKSPSGQRQSSGRVEFRTRANGGRLLALDSGYVNNSFSFAILRLDDGMPVVEGLGEIIPSYDAPINFPDLTHRILIPIVQNCGVQFVVSDRWQSLATLQTIEAQCGTPWENLRCVYEDFSVLREHIFDQTISLPKLEIPAKEVVEPKEDYPKCFMGKPVSHLLWQMFTVRDYPGKTVEKGGDSTDDLFRSVVLGVKALAIPEIAFILQEEPQVQERRIWGSTASLSSGTGKAVTTLGVAGGRGTGVGGSSYTGSVGSTGSKR